MVKSVHALAFIVWLSAPLYADGSRSRQIIEKLALPVMITTVVAPFVAPSVLLIKAYRQGSSLQNRMQQLDEVLSGNSLYPTAAVTDHAQFGQHIQEFLTRFPDDYSKAWAYHCMFQAAALANYGVNDMQQSYAPTILGARSDACLTAYRRFGNDAIAQFKPEHSEFAAIETERRHCQEAFDRCRHEGRKQIFTLCYRAGVLLYYVLRG